MNKTSTGWVVVTKAEPCPVCGKTDWCARTGDGEVVRCMRVPGSRKAQKGGWLHVMSEPLPERKIQTHEKVARELINWAALQEEYTRRRGEIYKLAGRLGLETTTLHRLGVGWTGNCWSFPMFDGNAEMVGMRLRTETDKKFAVKGSRNGIFWPEGVYENTEDILFIAEGPTDTGVLIELGFSAIGRASCNTGEEYIKEFLKYRRPVVIVADNDTPIITPDGSTLRPGVDGANSLSNGIRRRAKGVRVIVPGKYKDLREWYNKTSRRGKAARETILYWVNQRVAR